MADAQVALNANAGEKKDAAMQVAVELETYPSAHQLSKRPVVSTAIVIDEQRKRAHIQEVGCCQVQSVDVGPSQRTSGSPQLQNDSKIERQTDDKDHAVHHGEEDVLKILIVGAGGENR